MGSVFEVEDETGSELNQADAEFFFYAIVVLVMLMEGWSDGKQRFHKD